MSEDAQNNDHKTRALARIASCANPNELRQVAMNARAKGEEEVRLAAQRRLYEVLPSEQPGTLEYDVWQSIYALEGELSDERGKTIRLSRTRQKITRDKEAKTVADLIMGSPSEGYRMLIDRRLKDLTFEAVALRHPDRFDEQVLDAARSRLSAS